MFLGSQSNFLSYIKNSSQLLWIFVLTQVAQHFLLESLLPSLYNSILAHHSGHSSNPSLPWNFTRLNNSIVSTPFFDFSENLLPIFLLLFSCWLQYSRPHTHKAWWKRYPKETVSFITDHACSPQPQQTVFLPTGIAGQEKLSKIS